MSPVLETPPDATEERERKATPHTAVLEPDRRKDTELPSGLIPEKDAVRMAGYPGIMYLGIRGLEPLRLGDEVPYYEVAIHGTVYRGLARPVPGQSQQADIRDLRYMLARSCAQGLQVAGRMLEPSPAAMPNTPHALVRELQEVTGLPIGDIVDNAYSILNYRRHHGARYPDSMEPRGYRFRELFLMSVDADGNLKTFYETPAGVDPEKWTHFLRVLDREECDSLRQYAVSGMVHREYGEAGTQAIREALRLRDGELRHFPPMSYVPFLELFPLEFPTLERTVGGQRR